MEIYRWALGASALVLSNAASAQMLELPEIVVTSPSPIAARQTSENTIDNPPWSASSVSMPPAPSFNSVLVMTPQNTLSRGAASLGDTLGTAPGVSATSFSPVASRPVIRGLGGFRVRTQEDGIGSHDMANLGEDHAVTIDPLMSGQVEIIRGPGTLRYGSQAIGGVVSANNGRIPTSIPANGVTFQARGGFNSVSNGKDGAVLLDAGGGNLALHLDAFKRSAGDYRIPGGIQENSGYTSDGYSVGGSYIFNDGFIGLSYQNATMIYFIPGIDSAREKNHIDLRQEKWTGRGEWRVGQSGIDTVRYWLGFTDYKHKEIDGIGAAAEVGSTFKNREFESRVEISHLPFSTAFGELRGSGRGPVGPARSFSRRCGGGTAGSRPREESGRIHLRGIADHTVAARAGRRPCRAHNHRRHGRQLPGFLPAAARRPDSLRGQSKLCPDRRQRRALV